MAIKTKYVGSGVSWFYDAMVTTKDGKRHSIDGQPAVVRNNGDKFWYKNGKLHREDGPAQEWADGEKYWYENGKFIRSELE